jgi:hypothetical protein
MRGHVRAVEVRSLSPLFGQAGMWLSIDPRSSGAGSAADAASHGGV